MARDENSVPTLVAALNTDGTTVVEVRVEPTMHGLSVLDGNTGSDHGTLPAKCDDDRVPVLLGVSSADFLTPVEVYADASGKLLIDST